MQYQLSDVYLSDADMLIRQCEFPAMRGDPLQMIMFPKSDTNTYEEEEEAIKWIVEGLQESLEKESCYFRKVIFGPGCNVGFAIWTLESGSLGTKRKPTLNKRRESWIPISLDFRAWNQVSKRLREERVRVLHAQQTLWRLNTISVAPEHQRKGVGSMLLQWGCDKADLYGWNSFVMASPDGLPLYSKFDFKVVGQVCTEYGTFTSMLRESRRAVGKHVGQERKAELADIQLQI